MNPIAFEIFGVPVHWYGLIIAFGMMLALVLALYNAPSRQLKKDDPLELVLWLLPPAIIGARLYFLIYNGGPWGWDAFAIWNGGLAIYGGVIGGAIGLLVYCLVRKKSFLQIADVVVPSLILGQCIGRWGNFANQEAYGSLITNPSQQWFPFAVQIDSSNFTDVARDQCMQAFGYIPNTAWFNATFFYESMFSLITCIMLVLLLRNVNIRGIVTASYLIMYGIARSIIEGFRTDSLMLGSLRASQVLSIILIVLGVCLLVYILINHIKKQNIETTEVCNGKLQKRK